MTKRVAVLKGEAVDNVIVVDDDYQLGDNEDFVDGMSVGPGDFKRNGQYERKPQQKRIMNSIPRIDFMDRFTFDELEAIEAVADAPGAAKNKMRVAMKYLEAVQLVDLESPRTISLMDILVQSNIIDEARKTEILTIEEV